MLGRRHAIGLTLWMALGGAGAARAWPVDEVLDVPEGGHRFQKLLAVGWAHVDDPKVATVDTFPATGEVLLEGKAEGRTLVFAYAQGKLVVWQLRVGSPNRAAEGPSRAPRLKAARQECPSLEETPGREVVLKARIGSDACRRALLALFESDGPVAKELELSFEIQALQAQLSDIESALAAAKVKGLSVKYLGAGLVLSGTASEADHALGLMEIFRHSVGRVALEDRVESGP